jgi:signal transduction histidine kinase
MRQLEIARGSRPSGSASRISSDWFSGDLLETLPAAVHVCNAETVVVAHNRRASELWGRAPLPGDTDMKYCGSHKLLRADGGFLPHGETPMRRVLRTGSPARDMKAVIERPDRSRIPVLVNIAPLFDEGEIIGAVNCFQDLSAHAETEQERARLAEELHHAQKMEVIGQLTAGIVHDFNNLLAGIGANLEMLKRRIDEIGPLNLLRDATRSIQRGERLVQELLAFAHKQKLSPAAIDLDQVLSGMTYLLQTSIGGAVRMEMRNQPGLWPVLIDPNQIELVLLNLAINARDAMPDGGTLTIETSNARLKGTNRLGDLPAGDYAVMTVSDTGSGMSDEVRAKAFEPFFTTKAIGKGSGLGLSTGLGVVRQSGGDIRIASRRVGGTSIEIYLPRADGGVSSYREAAH